MLIIIFYNRISDTSKRFLMNCTRLKMFQNKSTKIENCPCYGLHGIFSSRIIVKLEIHWKGNSAVFYEKGRQRDRQTTENNSFNYSEICGTLNISYVLFHLFSNFTLHISSGDTAPAFSLKSSGYRKKGGGGLNYFF